MVQSLVFNTKDAETDRCSAFELCLRDWAEHFGGFHIDSYTATLDTYYMDRKLRKIYKNLESDIRYRIHLDGKAIFLADQTRLPTKHREKYPNCATYFCVELRCVKPISYNSSTSNGQRTTPDGFEAWEIEENLQ